MSDIEEVSLSLPRTIPLHEYYLNFTTYLKLDCESHFDNPPIWWGFPGKIYHTDSLQSVKRNSARNKTEEEPSKEHTSFPSYFGSCRILVIFSDFNKMDMIYLF